MLLRREGGSPYAVLGVVDTIQTIKPDVQIVALGATYSYSSLLLVRASCLVPGQQASTASHRQLVCCSSLVM